jgi:ABC-type glycerol-3-phosphate transport system substrate-binding protein
MKISMTLLILFSLLLGAGCTLQTTQPSPTESAPASQETQVPELPTSTTAAATEAPAATESQPVATEEVFPTETSTPDVVVDPYADVRPDDQYVYFWYFLPPQAPADQALNTIVDQFNQSNPYDIFIDAYNQSTADGVLTRTLPLLNTTDMPALVLTNPDLVYQLAGGLESLDALIGSPTWGFTEDVYASYNSGMIKQGQFPEFSTDLYAFPALRTAQILYLNTDWASENGYYPPFKTTQELSDLACTTAANPMRSAPVAHPIGLEISPGIGSFAALTRAFGGTIQPEEANVYQLNTAGSLEAMQYLAEFGRQNCLEFPTGDQLEYQNFAGAAAAMLLANSKELPGIDDQIRTGLNFNWNSTGVPTPDQGQQIVLLPGHDFSIAKHSPEQIVAAWEFVKYFHSQEAQEIWIPATGNIPLAPSVAANIRMPNAYLNLLSLVETAEILPAFPQAEQIDDLIQDAMQRVLDGSPTEQVLNELQNSVEALTTSFYTSP